MDFVARVDVLNRVKRIQDAECSGPTYWSQSKREVQACCFDRPFANYAPVTDTRLDLVVLWRGHRTVHDLTDHESRAPLLTTEKVTAWASTFKALLVTVTLVNKNPEVIQNARSIKSGSRYILQATVFSETNGGVYALVTRSASRTAFMFSNPRLEI